MFIYWYFNEPVVVVVAPHLVKEVLSTKVKYFEKDHDEIIAAVVGHGLLLSNGDFWKKQKRLMVCLIDLLLLSFEVVSSFWVWLYEVDDSLFCYLCSSLS
jgi:hypothetical protein